MTQRTRIKICGLTREADVLHAVQAGADGAPRVLVNLGGDLPDAGAPVDRVIEIVAAEDAAEARERWRAYKAMGPAMKHHDAAARGG